MKALIIDEPWISKILRGEKRWEMRSRHASHRGRIALIRKGSGQVVGVAELTGSEGPLDLSRLRAAAGAHQIPLHRYESGELIQWDIAWKLAGAQPLRRPVSYRHPYGAVTWVNLSPDEAAQVEAELGGAPDRPHHETAHTSIPARPFPVPHPPSPAPAPAGLLPATQLPVARDGTCFHPGLRRACYFTIGEKGDERRIGHFSEALQALRQMSVPRWRRPNDQNNWGIVSGVRWERADRLGITL